MDMITLVFFISQDYQGFKYAHFYFKCKTLYKDKTPFVKG